MPTPRIGDKIDMRRSASIVIMHRRLLAGGGALNMHGHFHVDDYRLCRFLAHSPDHHLSCILIGLLSGGLFF